MFEVPDWAECSAAHVPGLPVCLRLVTQMVTIMCAGSEVGFESLGTCNRHVEIVEAHLAARSDLPPITLPKAQFPAFMLGMVAGAE